MSIIRWIINFFARLFGFNSPASQPINGMMGVWKGSYVNWTTNDAVPFELRVTTVDEDLQTFRGVVNEDSRLGRSTVYGRYSFEKGTIWFMKRYNSLNYSVQYDGKLTEETSASGRYFVSGNEGEWSMQKSS